MNCDLTGAKKLQRSYAQSLFKVIEAIYIYLSNMCLNHFAFKSFIVRQLFTCLAVFIISSPVYSQTKRAFLVGISEYPQTGERSWNDIHGSNDLELISETLKAQSFKTTSLTNKTATANNIRKGLNNLVVSCKPGDFVYLHFSCHGQPFEDLDGDEEDGWDESIVPYDAQMVYEKGKYEGANHITDDELHTYFQQLRNVVGINGYVCVVIDACHAGNSYMGDEEEEEEVFCRGIKKGFSPNRKDFHPRINAKGHYQISKGDGLSDITILEACRSYQSNYEIKQSGKYYGPLSYYISQVLSSQELTASTNWIFAVKNMMNADSRLTRQNMVYETSIE